MIERATTPTVRDWIGRHLRASGVPGDSIDDAVNRLKALVTIRRGDRSIALAVDEVLDIRPVVADELVELPSLLSDVDDGIVSALGQLDQGLLFVLGHARLIPEDAWAALPSHLPSHLPGPASSQPASRAVR